MKDLRARLLRTFEAELEQQLAVMNADLLALESTPDDGDRLRSLFRCAHTLKGAARAVGLTAVERVCHEMESRLAAARDGEAPLEPGDFPIFFAAADVLAGVRRLLAEGRPVPDTGLEELLANSGERPAATPGPGGGDDTDESGPAPASVEGGDTPAARSAAAPRGLVRVARERILELQGAVGMLEGERSQMAEWAAAADDLADAAHALGERWRRGSVGLRGGPRRLGNGAEHGEDIAAAIHEVGERVGRLSDRARAASRTFGRAVDEVLRATREIRVRPFLDACEQLPRAVRDLAAASGKEVSLELDVDATEVDRLVIDALRDPLLQLVRNAVDHGVEPPERRRQAGKATKASLRVAARVHGDRLLVEVSDDGAGIDTVSLRAALAARGAAVPESDEELVGTLFAGGLSSKARATEISGRGVGLDIVRDAVNGIQGTLAVDWRAGLGTTFTIETPVSLATSRVLFVRVQTWTFAIPTAFVERVLRPSSDTIRRSQGQLVLLHESGAVPLSPLARILGPPFQETAEIEGQRIVLLRSGPLRTAVLVDAAVDERESVMQPSGSIAIPLELVGGATMLPGGEIAPVLRVPAMFAAGAEAAYGAEVRTRAEGPERKRRVLVVDDSITTRTLERGIIEAEGYDVEVAADGAEGWRMLQERPFDIVVSDVEMPRMDGVDLCRMIRTSARLRELPVVLVTARESEEDRRRGLEAGADAYIGKSGFDRSELLETMRDLLGDES